MVFLRVVRERDFGRCLDWWMRVGLCLVDCLKVFADLLAAGGGGCAKYGYGDVVEKRA